MNERKKSKCIGMLGALFVHVAIIALLFLFGFTFPAQQEESGIPVMMGDSQDAYGGFDPSSLVDVDLLNQQESEVVPQPQESAEQDLITQVEEETVVVRPKAESKKKEVKKSEQTEIERAEETRRLVEEKVEQERKKAAEVAAKAVSGAFGKGAQMGNKGETVGEGVVGSLTGNESAGAVSGSNGYGTFDLGGRSIGPGGLPRPVYNVQDEGRVVVTITVNPQGIVVATSINRLTNTVNPVLRKAAEDAARKAQFNVVEGVNNQTGTITYYFNLR